MKKLIVLAGAVLTVSSVAMASDPCVNLAGQYVMTSQIEDGIPQPTTNAGPMTITQTGCQEMVLSSTEADGSLKPVLDTIVDGQAHVVMRMDDVHVAITLTSRFEGNALIGDMGMESLPGQKMGEIKFELSPDGKTLTYTTTTQGHTNVIVAAKQ